MNTGVEILLQRMKDNPEDFYYTGVGSGMSRWRRLLDHALSDEILTDEERDAINMALRETRRERFTELVMKELAGEGEASDEGKTRMYTTAPNAMGLAGVTLGQSSSPYQQATATLTASGNLTTNSLTLGQTQLRESELQMMKAQLQAQQAQMQHQQTQHQTLVGKLFNYLGK